MAKFFLQPCRLREDKLVPTKEPKVEFKWLDLVSRLAPSKSKNAQMVLRRMERGCFIGLVLNEQTKEAVNFLLLNPDRSGSVKALLRKDPSFERRLIEVFRVEDFAWDAKMEELGSASAEAAA